jgi:hypothetical protein
MFLIKTLEDVHMAILKALTREVASLGPQDASRAADGRGFGRAAFGVGLLALALSAFASEARADFVRIVFDPNQQSVREDGVGGQRIHFVVSDVLGTAGVTVDGIGLGATAVSGDTTNDIAEDPNLINDSCTGAVLPGAGASCSFDVRFSVRDADPSDVASPTDDTGVWQIGTSVDFKTAIITARPTVTVADCGAPAPSALSAAPGSCPVVNPGIGTVGAFVPVPEPATWTLLMLGVSGVGAVARSRRALPS